MGGVGTVGASSFDAPPSLGAPCDAGGAEPDAVAEAAGTGGERAMVGSVDMEAEALIMARCGSWCCAASP